MRRPSRPRLRTRFALSLSGFAAIAACLAAAPSALADGYCGQDYTGAAACAVNSASTPSYNGTIVADNDIDYYVFHAAAGTHLSLSIAESENPQCSSPDWSGWCGSVGAELYDARDSDLGGTGQSSPSGGLTIPQTWSTIISQAGTYYLEVSGDHGVDANGNPTAVPYTLTIQASPAVQWPAPPPPPPPPACVIPHYGGQILASIKHRLTAGHCRVGAVHYEYSAVRRGRVVKLSSGADAHLTNGAGVAIWISRGRRPRRR